MTRKRSDQPPAQEATPARPRRTRVTLDLGADLAKRLRVHVMLSGGSESALVAELLDANIPRYRVQTLGRESG